MASATADLRDASGRAMGTATATQAGDAIRIRVDGMNLPAGAHYTMVSSTTDANGCTRTVRYSSDGSGAAPQVTRASAGACDAVPGGNEPLLVNVPAPAAERPAPGLEV